jgi:hypothetical protein
MVPHTTRIGDNRNAYKEGIILKRIIRESGCKYVELIHLDQTNSGLT